MTFLSLRFLPLVGPAKMFVRGLHRMGPAVALPDRSIATQILVQKFSLPMVGGSKLVNHRGAEVPDFGALGGDVVAVVLHVPLVRDSRRLDLTFERALAIAGDNLEQDEVILVPTVFSRRKYRYCPINETRIY